MIHNSQSTETPPKGKRYFIGFGVVLAAYAIALIGCIAMLKSSPRQFGIFWAAMFLMQGGMFAAICPAKWIDQRLGFKCSGWKILLAFAIGLLLTFTTLALVPKSSWKLYQIRPAGLLPTWMVLVVGVSHFAGIFVSSNEKKCDILSPVFDEEPSQDSNPYAPPRLSKQRTN